MSSLPRTAPIFYSPFLALPAPRIAGLLPAPKPVPPPRPFLYAEPQRAALPDNIRAQFDTLARTLLDATASLLVDERNEAEFALAVHTFSRQITLLYHGTVFGDRQPLVTSPFAQRRQQLNDKLDRMVANSKLHMAETRERIARELASMHAREDAL